MLSFRHNTYGLARRAVKQISQLVKNAHLRSLS
jgi:hypothetical protein